MLMVRVLRIKVLEPEEGGVAAGGGGWGGGTMLEKPLLVEVLEGTPAGGMLAAEVLVGGVVDLRVASSKRMVA